MLRALLVTIVVLMAGCTQFDGAAPEGWTAVAEATQSAEGAILELALVRGTESAAVADVESLALFVTWPDGAEREAAVEATTVEGGRVLVETTATGFDSFRVEWRLRLTSGETVETADTPWETHTNRRYQAHASLAGAGEGAVLTVQLYEVAPGARGALEYTPDGQGTLRRVTDLVHIEHWQLNVAGEDGTWRGVDAVPELRRDAGQVVVRFDATGVKDMRPAFELRRESGGTIELETTDLRVSVDARPEAAGGTRHG